MPLLAGISTGFQRLSKYLSKAAKKRLPLSPKRAGKGFYKGNNCASTGRVNSIGTYIGRGRERKEEGRRGEKETGGLVVERLP